MSIMQEGSVVSLKSGGPTMTVSSRLSQGMCVCHWFVGDTIQEFTFNENELTDTKSTNNSVSSDSGQTTLVQSSYGQEEYSADASQPVESHPDYATEAENSNGTEDAPGAVTADSSMTSFPQTSDDTGMADNIVAEALKISGASGN